LTELLLMGVVAIVLFAAATFLLLRVAQWLGGKKAVVILGAAMVGLIALAIFDILRTCGADPVIVPTGGGERADFACDGPGGAFIYGFAYLVCPAAAALVALLAYCVARRPREINSNVAV
jgi:hypothetical protein